MGGANSTTSTTSVITNSISNSIISAIQDTSAEASANQNVEMACPVDLIATQWNYYLKCLELYKNKSTDDIVRTCGAISKSLCSGDHIDIKNNIQVNITDKQQTVIEQKVKSKLKNKIKEELKQSTGLLQFGNSVETKLDVVTTTVQNSMVDITQSSITSLKNMSQNVTIKGGNLSYVSLEMSITLIADKIQSVSAVQKSIAELSTAVDLEVSQSGSSFGLLNTVLTVIGTVGGLLLLIFIILRLIKKKRATKQRMATR